ncbi:MAG: DUF177 domain-containing protein [Myxococcaceae bacterium]|nr:DUF177 domain-containing protein [Myxococcaceae bacterium]
MLVKIEEIQEPGLELTQPIERKVLDAALAESEGFRLVSATPLSASFRKVSGQVHVRGSFEAEVTCPCRRCTKDVALSVPVEFSLRMVREAPRPDEDEEDEAPAGAKPARRRRQAKDDDDEGDVAASFELDEVDAEPFDGKTIDLDPIVREQVLLALPVTVLCREDCKGLCATCGQDLNEKDCGHSEKKEIDVRLAKLKDIKLKN